MTNWRPDQLEGVQSVLAGNDTLCIMSTGSGKPAIYQLAGLLSNGPTVEAVLRPEDLGLRRFFAPGAVDRDALDRVARLLAAARRYRTLDTSLVSDRGLLTGVDG